LSGGPLVYQSYSLVTFAGKSNFTDFLNIIYHQYIENQLLHPKISAEKNSIIIM